MRENQLTPAALAVIRIGFTVVACGSQRAVHLGVRIVAEADLDAGLNRQGLSGGDRVMKLAAGTT